MKKRLLSILLTLCMALSLLPAVAFAEGGAKAIQSGTAGIHGYNTESGYSYIYYGTWRDSPIKWRVLDTKANTGAAGALFLLTDECLYPLPGNLYACYIQFNPSTKPDRHLWKDSTLQGWFKNTFYSGENSAFTFAERALIPATTQEDSMYILSNLHMRLQICALEAEHVFAPSIQDIMNADYGFTDSTSRIAGPTNSTGTSGTRYWLRSFEMGEKIPFMVGVDASLYGDSSGDNPAAVRPAMYLTTTGNNILFISAAEGGKPAGGLKAVSQDYTGSKWKLTLLDSSRSGFAVTTTSVSTTNYGGDIQIEYSGAKTGDNEYISVLLKDSDGNPTYYGRSAALTEASGTVTIPVAAGLAAGDATLYVYNEQYNGDKKTDLASELKSVSLTVAEAATYTVTYAPGENGTGTASTATKLEGTPLTLAGASFTRTGYTQTGWATVDGGEKDYALGAIYEENAPITLYPVWTANQYTVTLNSNGGGDVTPSTVTVTYGEDYPAMPVLQRAGYIFHGWYDAQADGKQYVDADGNSTARYDKTSDCTLYARWSEAPPCTVTFDPNGGTLAGSTTSNQTSNNTVQYKPDDPTREGHNFLDWYKDSACTQLWDFNDWVTGDMTLYAGWRINQYTISFDTAGGSAIAPIMQDYDTAITDPAVPTRTGYTFTGWDPELPATMPAKVMTVTAQWRINQYTITFDTAGGSAIAPITQDYDTAITAPAAPAREGYTFIGWDKMIPATMPAENVTVTARWRINQYTITFDTAGGSEIAPITQDYGTAITAPAAPTREGYTFTGWDKMIPATMPAGDMTIKANWTVNQYTITYDLNGGKAEGNPDSYTVETDAFTLKNPTRPGFTFTGWSGTGLTGEDNLTVTIPKGSTGDRSYTAHWRYNGSGYSYYTIKATAGTGGSISPSGNVSVRAGRDQTFTITPDKGYAVSNVKIDGRSIGAVKSYTFENVRRNHTIEVSFARANEFIDVPAGSYFYEAVMWAVENGVTTGASASRFDPNGICTRAQAVTFLWRAAGSPAPRSRTMPFTDVPVGSYYYDAVLWAVENGITEGTSDTTFSPDATCSRAQIVTFLWRSEKSPASGTVAPFADVKSTAYYAGAVLWAVKEDITKGTTNTTFSPDADCTRAQIVTFLWRCKK